MATDAEAGWDWDAEAVADQPGYGAPIAAYQCDNCGTIFPVHAARDVEEPWEEIRGQPCGERWGGCGEVHSATLVSDGFVLEWDGPEPFHASKAGDGDG